MGSYKMIQKWCLMIIVLLILLAAPEAMAAEKLVTPGNVHWDGYKAVWDAVQNADYYSVSVEIQYNEGKYYTGDDTKKTSLDVRACVLCTMNSWGITSGEITLTLKVSACTDDPDHFVRSDDARCAETTSISLDDLMEMLDEPLETPAVEWQNFVAVWDEVPLAEYYYVKYRIKSARGDFNRTTYWHSNTIDLSEDILSRYGAEVSEDLTVTITFETQAVIKVTGKTQTSEWYTKTFEFNLNSTTMPRISAPAHLRWDGTTAQWDGVDGAACYDVYCKIQYNGKTIETNSIRECKENQYDFQNIIRKAMCSQGITDGPVSVEFSVRTRPIKTGEVLFSSFTAGPILQYTTTEIQQLDNPTGVTLSGTTVEWNQVANADSYRVEMEVDLPLNGYTNTIRPSTGIDQPANGNPSFDYKEYLLSNVRRYNLFDSKVDIRLIIRAARKNSSVYAMSSGYLISTEFDLVSPDAEAMAAPRSIVLNGLTASWDRTDGARAYNLGYEISINGRIYTGELACKTNQCDLEQAVKDSAREAGQNEGTAQVRVRVQALPANVIDYLASGFSGFSEWESISFAFLPKLDTPQNIRRRGMTVIWDSVQNADYYRISLELNVNGTVLAEQQTSTGEPWYDTEQIIDEELLSKYPPDQYQIQIKTRIQACSYDSYGETQYEESFSSAPYSFYYDPDYVDPNKLPTPDGVSWNGTTGGWNQVQGTSYYYVSYEVAIGNRTVSLNTMTTSRIHNFAYEVTDAACDLGISEGTASVRFRVRAYPSAYEENGKSDFSEYSPWQEFTITGVEKLETPGGLNWNGTECGWTAVPYAQSYIVEISILSKSKEVYHNSSHCYQSTAYDCSYLIRMLRQSGKLSSDIMVISFTVQAIDGYNAGSMTRFAVSDFSEECISYININNPEKVLKVSVLPSELSEIADYAFENTSFEAIIIPDGCTSIGEMAFANCDNLKYVWIPSSVTTIAQNAFYGSENAVIDR